MALQRLDQTVAQSAACCNCNQQVPARLLWSLEPAPPLGSLWCAACLTFEVWSAIATNVLEANDAIANKPRCDRCMRRARPTSEHHGFNLCGECMHRPA